MVTISPLFVYDQVSNKVSGEITLHPTAKTLRLCTCRIMTNNNDNQMPLLHINRVKKRIRRIRAVLEKVCVLEYQEIEKLGVCESCMRVLSQVPQYTWYFSSQVGTQHGGAKRARLCSG